MTDMETVVVLFILNMTLTAVFYFLFLSAILFERKKNSRNKVLRDEVEKEPIILGMRVRHSRYGSGTVTSVTADTFWVNFDKYGGKEFSTLLCAVLGVFRII